MKRTIFVFLFFAFSVSTPAQQKKDSCSMEISLLTCAPGTDLYSIFGHTAIRVRDSVTGVDVVYNYGTFDDSDPMFYIKFMRGIMRYSLSAETYENFMQEYEYEHRSVVAQILNLNCGEKNVLFEALKKNTLEENRFYDYHFHRDNCTTRAGRVIETNTGDSLIYKNILQDKTPVDVSPGNHSFSSGLTFRDMIHEYLDKEQASWSEFGIDLFLGANLDAKVTNSEAIHFLPDYLYRGMDIAVSGNKPIVKTRKVLLNFSETKHYAEGLTPKALFICLFLATIILFIFRTSPALAKTLLIFDIIFFSALGLLGILMTSMWLGRVDDVCRNNINIAWALPTHLPAVFFIRKKTSWIKYYFLITAIIAALLAIGFNWWPQTMNSAVLPILGIIIFRSFYQFQNRNHAENVPVPRGKTELRN
jgi:membrane protein implicated in regulation of membrane protease activity